MIYYLNVRSKEALGVYGIYTLSVVDRYNSVDHLAKDRGNVKSCRIVTHK